MLNVSWTTALLGGCLALLLAACSGGESKTAAPEGASAGAGGAAEIDAAPAQGEVEISATISAANGGTLATSDGRLALTFPGGAVAGDTRVAAKLVPQNQWPDYVKAAGPIGRAFSLEPDGLKFAKPVEISYRLSDTDLAGLDPSRGFPLLALLTRTADGAISPLDNPVAGIDVMARSITFTASTTHFSQILVSQSADVTFKPEQVTAFVDGPPWTVVMEFNNPLGAAGPISVHGITYRSERPVIGRPGLTSHPAFTVKVNSTQGLGSAPPTFDCLKGGVGFYSVVFGVSYDFQSGGRTLTNDVFHQLYSYASCLKHPELKAALQAPTTVFTVAGGDGDYAWNELSYYAWKGAISCGIFTPSIRTGGYYSGGLVARWSHPNAPTPDEENLDFNGDGIPDFCPHTETPNFSHPGTITVEMVHRPIRGGGPAYCTYEGSLSGTGQCHPGKAP